MSDSWKSPTTTIALVTLLLSICGNVFQFYNYKLDKEKWETEKGKWEVEKENIAKQNNDLQERLDVFLKEKSVQENRVIELKEEIDKLAQEIDAVTKEINAAIFAAQLATSTMLSSESTEEEQNSAHMRSQAALERAKELEKSKENLILKKKEKEAEYNNIVFRN